MGLLAHTVAGDVKFNLETWADPLFEWFDDLHAVQMMPIKASMRKSHVRIALLSKSKECSKKLAKYLGRAQDLNVEPTSVYISNWIMDGDQNWESKRDLWYIAQVYALKLKSQDRQALLDIALPVLHRDRVGYEMLYGVGQPSTSTVSVRAPKRTLRKFEFSMSFLEQWFHQLPEEVHTPALYRFFLIAHAWTGRKMSECTHFVERIWRTEHDVNCALHNLMLYADANKDQIAGVGEEVMENETWAFTTTRKWQLIVDVKSVQCAQDCKPPSL